MSERRPIAVDPETVISTFRRIDARIVPAADLDRAARLLNEIPAVPWWTILETRILGQGAATDLFVGVLRTPEVCRTLLSAHGAPTEHARFFELWADDAGPGAGSNVMWFEWDAPVGSGKPMLWYSVDETFWPQPNVAPTGLPAPIRLAHLRSTAAAPTDPARIAAFEAIVDALPAFGRIFGSMWLGSRGQDVDRLFIDLPRTDAMAFLDRIGWPGDMQRVEEWLARVTAPWERALLQIEVTDAVGPYIALETRQSDGLPPEARKREDAYFNWLIEAHGASERHLQCLVDWRGVEQLACSTERRSFHVKAVLRHLEPPVVKGYFGVHYSRG